MLSEDQVACIKELARLVADEREPARLIMLLEELRDVMERSQVLSKKRAPVIPIPAKSARKGLG